MSTAQNDTMDLSPAKLILARVRENADPGHDLASYLIPILQEVQEAYGYLPVPVLNWISSETHLPTSRMYGVITFYSQFSMKPRGRHTIRCCQGTACHVKGSTRIMEAVMQALHVKEGETTGDMDFTFETVSCLGTCFLAPVMMVDGDYHGLLTPTRIPSILEKYRRGSGA